MTAQPPSTAPVVTMPVPASVRQDRITLLLLGATVFFAILLVVVDKLFPNEGQVFQVLANLTSGFAGAFFTRIQPATTTHAAGPAPVIPFPNGITTPSDSGAAAPAAPVSPVPPVK